MKSVFALGANVAVAALAVGLAPACSSTPDAFDPPITQCDPAKCAPGNLCLAMDGDLKCRKPCTSNADPAGSCPSNYFCSSTNVPSTIPAGCTKVDVTPSKALCSGLSASSGTRLTAFHCPGAKPTGCLAADAAGNFCCNEAPAETLAQPVCVKIFRDVATPGPKQWGAVCDPTKGLEENPDCDAAQGFFCRGTSPTDATSYCTRYDCLGDRECAAGFSCATINVGPNVATAKRTYHEVRTACLRREYCAPCNADVDCPPLAGRPQRCVPDQAGAGFCAPECATSKNCNPESKCVDGGIGVKTCYPRAGTCVGDGSLCSPCSNDAQCGDDGLCVKGSYTTERFCAKKSATTCTEKTNGCPPSSKPGVEVFCAAPDPKDPGESDNYCYGTYEIGESRDAGCYSPARL